MDRTERPPVPASGAGLAQAEPAPALAAAAEILMRAAADQAAADEARVRLHRDGLPALAPDERIASLVDPGERLVAVRTAALLDRRAPNPGAPLTPGVAGDLYVTSRRLVLIGRLVLAFELDAIADAVVSGERLLLVLTDGQGVMLQVAQPRRLAVELAAARSAARASSAAAPSASADQPATR